MLLLIYLGLSLPSCYLFSVTSVLHSLISSFLYYFILTNYFFLVFYLITSVRILVMSFSSTLYCFLLLYQNLLDYWWLKLLLLSQQACNNLNSFISFVFSFTPTVSIYYITAFSNLAGSSVCWQQLLSALISWISLFTFMFKGNNFTRCM